MSSTLLWTWASVYYEEKKTHNTHPSLIDTAELATFFSSRKFLEPISALPFQMIILKWKRKTCRQQRNAYSLNFRSCFFFIWYFHSVHSFFISDDFHSENIHITKKDLWERKSVNSVRFSECLEFIELHTVWKWLHETKIHGSMAITNKTSYMLLHKYASNRKKSE